MSTGIPNLGNADITGSAHNGRRPSQVHGHIEYAKGVVSETIGSMVNSSSWQQSGESHKASGIAEMRSAKEMVDKDLRSHYPERNATTLKTEGKSQNMLGKTIGCQGMVERGGEKEQIGDMLKKN
ncbi:hypothetical protein FPQ18DRAFT_391857 [Pyronema domesticum]|uniref:CsbD-like domain-containing protein n=1 Tax=Pyronema omphalodes (strain CBS 100304) TaxID=1076935 RepID=U4L2T5_PYROM|nr:hypothetical protein FPQ18DRAFT_391857 [Pyronema domesticum]CCX10647.1 Similar to hypothetical protein MAA_08709 [Metarhizium anisopliae ARSEF 23]; acc. no. EFY95901 [Pyronema omphalodes CBS 100304]